MRQPVCSYNELAEQMQRALTHLDAYAALCLANNLRLSRAHLRDEIADIEAHVYGEQPASRPDATT